MGINAYLEASVVGLPPIFDTSDSLESTATTDDVSASSISTDANCSELERETSGRRHSHSVGIVLEEIGRGLPGALIPTETHAGLSRLETLDLSNGDELARFHVELVDLGEVGVPETRHDLKVHRVVFGGQRGIPEAVHGELELLWWLGLCCGRHVG